MNIKKLLYRKLTDCIYPERTPTLNERNSIYLGTTTLREVPDMTDEFYRIWFTRFNNWTKWFFIFRDFIEDLLVRYRFVSYAEYQVLHAEKGSDYNTLTSKYPIYRLMEVRNDRQRSKYINSYPNTLIGYYVLMEKKNRRLYDHYTSPQIVRLSEDSKQTHNYIVGGTKSGKSELIKHMILQDIGKNNKAVILIEPNGDLAEQVAKQKDIDQSRLVYIDCSYSPCTPSLNPFDNVRDTDVLEIEKQIQIIRSAFEQICKEFGQEVTLQMQSILTPCLEVIARKGGTLRDLQRFMVEETNADLVEYGLTIPKHHEFFAHTFNKAYLNVSKQGIYQKLLQILNFTSFDNFFCGASTIDLVKALNEKKIIIFNLSKGKLGTLAAESIGKMLIAIMQNLIFQRAEIPEEERTPAALYVDEFQDFVNDSIEELFVQGRKYAVSCTVASQVLGQGLSPEMTKVILGNTSNKFVGRNGHATLSQMSKEAFSDIEYFKKLPTGKFFTTIDKANGFILSVGTKHLGRRTCIDQQAWTLLLREQMDQYYKPRPAVSLRRQDKKNPPQSSQSPQSPIFKPKF